MEERTLKITRPKKFVGCISPMYVYIDGEKYGNIPNGETGYIKVDCNKHVVWIENVYQNQGKAETIIGEKFYVPADGLDYHLHIVFEMGFFKSKIRWNEDEEQIEKNKVILAEQQYEHEITEKIRKAIESEINKSMPDRDFSAFNLLDEETRNSKWAKNFVYKTKENYYKELTLDLWDGKTSVAWCLESLKTLLDLKEISEEISHMLRHYDYMVNRRNDINSILSLEVEKELSEIDKNEIEVIEEDVWQTWKKALEAKERGDMQEALNLLLMSDVSEEELDKLKRNLLKGAMIEGKAKETTEFYQNMLRMNKCVFNVKAAENGKVVTLKTVDMIIAEAIRYYYVNSMDDVDDDLKEFLEWTAPTFRIDASQYTILQKVFAYFKAYSQEKMVLAAMVKNFVARTSEQEERLVFLQSKGMMESGNIRKLNEIDIGRATECDNIVLEHGRVLYEYRCMTWKNKEIKDFFDTMSMESKTIHIPIVVSEWMKNVTVKGIEWSAMKVKERIEKRLTENFGDRYRIGVVESSIAGVRLDYTETIFIMDSTIELYPWLAFNVCGEQTMPNQLLLSVYGMYLPDLDIVDDDASVYDRNSEMVKMVEMLKEKQNPKISNYIQIMTDLLVEELEHWVNDVKSTDLYI